MAKVTVNDTCIGCSACAGICPEVFDMNADGLAENILGDDVPAELDESVKEAAEACPVSAIIVE